jgi:agmatine deiminase
VSRLPPEWDPHERTIIAWPSRDERWDDVDEAAAEVAEIANAVVQFEPVTVLADPAHAADARALLSGDVELIESPLDDAWLRDSGPVVVPDRAIGFAFNGWGGRWAVEHDATLPERVAQLAALSLERSPLVLEGGAFAITADRTLIAAASCLLNPNRNPGRSREDVEEELVERLGVARVVWLDRGLDSDDDTDGHVDRFLTPVPSGDVLLQHADDDHVDFEVLTEAAHQLQHAGIDVLLFDVVAFADDHVPFPYLAGYACNDAILVPQSGDPVLDERALEVYRLAFPECEPIGVPATALALGGGGVSTVCLPIPGDPE